MAPRGLLLHRTGELQHRFEQASTLLSACTLCPRKCLVNRREGKTGICGTASLARIASYNPHFGEESVLVGKNGSGTIFLAGCNLSCCFCQNYDISHDASVGIEGDPDRLAAIMLELQEQGCHNINFVSPSHVVPQILSALQIAFSGGLNIPLVYNCSGYESVDTLKLLDGMIDIYMPDFKFWSETSASRYAKAGDYPEMARRAITEMHRQVGDLETDENGIASRGLLIRHLLMPGGIDETHSILEYIATRISPTTYVNIMDQYRPRGTASLHEELRSGISHDHYLQALKIARRVGLTRLDQRDIASLLKRLGITR